MCTQKHTLAVAALIACAGVAAAWQSALSAVGWTDAQATRIAESFFTASNPLPGLGYMSPATKQRWLGRAPAERAQAIRDLALHAKRYVQTPAFEKLYNGWIKEHYKAENHGIRIDTRAAAAPDMRAAMGEAAAAMSQAFAQLPADQLRMLLTNDIRSLEKSNRERDKPMLERYRRIQPLLETNLAEARKQYATAKAMQIGGGSNEAELQANMAAGAKAAAERQRMEEQRAWDEHNLKATLRRRLTGFIAIAESVDFAAQTQRLAGRIVFTNPEFERKPHDWKILYRLGKEPTLAALAVAKQWLREL